MLRSFCVGAFVGFLFGSTKKGCDVREGIDEFLTELTSGDAMKALDDKKNELTEMASSTFSKFAGKLSPEDKEEQNFEPQADTKEDDFDYTAGAGKALDADKAQELADKLGAKPSAPEDENLAAFSHHDDELKSA